VLVPVTIAAVFVADITLRLLPHDLFSFRAWEAMRTPGEDAPFLPSHRYHSDRTYGNLAAVGNLRALRQYRSVTFTTDELGYANPPDLARRGGAAAIVFGSSFAAGSELGDDSTLAAQLSRQTGRTVYNAGGGDPNLAEIRSLARRLVAPGGLVIFEYPERRDVPLVTPGHVSHKTARCHEVLAPHSLTGVCPMLGWLDRHAAVSPLQILSQRGLRLLEDGRWLPNPYAATVLQARLRDGQDMLFLAEERVSFHLAAANAPVVRYFRWLDTKLQRENIRLLVVLVPRKYTVYAPLLEPPDPGPDESAPYLDRVDRGLRAAAVPAVNLTAPFRTAAAAAVGRSEGSIYFPDDTHWNAAGAALAARDIARIWHGLPRRLAPDRRRHSLLQPGRAESVR
jgi:hypothetical protein